MELLGIDIGGSGIKGALVDVSKGRLRSERHRIDTPHPATPSAVIETVERIIDFFEWKGPVGCGFPAVVQHDIVKTASNIDDSWIGRNPASEIQKATHCPTHLVNDVDAAGMAEMTFGVGQGQKGMTVMIAAGTGIGSALFLDDQLLPNTEFGFIDIHGMPAEHYASNAVRKKEKLSLEEWASRFNQYLQKLEFLLHPDLLILGGGISKNFEEYAHWFDLETKIVPAKSRNHAGIIGAALCAGHLGKNKQ